MYDRILKKLREKVRTLDYVMTLHAEEEKDADELSIMDVEHCVLGGDVTERQRDAHTAEVKYRIVGRSMNGRPMEVICKIGPTDKLVIITVYAL
jgi:hypothetical protein